MKFKIRPIYKDISITFVAEAAVLVSFFITYRIIADNYGPEGVGEYSLVKRVVGLLQPLLLFGLTLGVPRYIAMSKDAIQRSAYIKATGFIVFFLSAFFLILANIFRKEYTEIFFGSQKYDFLVYPTSVLLFGLILHSLVYSYFRGRLFVKFFNYLQIINLSLVPMLILLFYNNINIGKLIELIGIITLTISFIFSLYFIGDIFISTTRQQFMRSLKTMLYYSLPRFLAGFIYTGFFSLSAIFAVHLASIREVGYFTIGQSLLTSLSITVAPLSLILFPKISSMIEQKREAEIKENLNYLIGATIQCSFFVFVQFMIFADSIVVFWLGNDFLSAVPVLRIILISTIFYLFCGALGSVLEASRTKPVNLLNLCVSLAVFLIALGFLLLFNIYAYIISLSVALTIGLACLGILTYVSIRKIYPEKLSIDLNYILIAISINLFLGIFTIILKPLLSYSFYYIIIFEFIVGFAYIFILWSLKTDWLRKIPRKILLTK